MSADVQLTTDSQCQAKPGPDFAAEANGRFERMIIRMLCEPVLDRLPAKLHPNHISLITHVVVWATAVCAVLSRELPRPWKSAILLLAGFGMAGQMVGDCLDGMYARRTSQCSKLGEMLDHWLDANVVPLVTIGISLALDMPTWAIILVNITSTMIYQAQLVLYHHTGRFVQPDTANGVQGQFGVAIGYVAIAVLFLFVDPSARWLRLGIMVLGTAAVVVQLRCSWFFYPQIGRRHFGEHLRFVCYLGAFGLLHWVGAIDVFGFVTTVVFISFRISGSYVLFTLLKTPYNGRDFGLFACIVAIAAGHFFVSPVLLLDTTLQNLLPYVTSSYLVLRNLIDFVRYYKYINPPKEALCDSVHL